MNHNSILNRSGNDSMIQVLYTHWDVMLQFYVGKEIRIQCILNVVWIICFRMNHRSYIRQKKQFFMLTMKTHIRLIQNTIKKRHRDRHLVWICVENFWIQLIIDSLSSWKMISLNVNDVDILEVPVLFRLIRIFVVVEAITLVEHNIKELHVDPINVIPHTHNNAHIH